jgi:hypothetical protein
MWLQWHFKIKVYVAVETETSGRVTYQRNRMLKYNIRWTAVNFSRKTLLREVSNWPGKVPSGPWPLWIRKQPLQHCRPLLAEWNSDVRSLGIAEPPSYSAVTFLVSCNKGLETFGNITRVQCTFKCWQVSERYCIYHKSPHWMFLIRIEFTLLLNGLFAHFLWEGDNHSDKF